MELILKPTAECNFACTFCSAADLHIKHLTSIPQNLAELVKKLRPTNLIITGGDPLCISPEVYYELLQLGEFSMSLTTNLKSFVDNPDKWLPLFKDRRVGVCTSFQYGDNRQVSPGIPYTEEMFEAAFKLFEQKVGYKLKFIAVINEQNEHFALKHLELAKQLGTKCKLNAVMKLGKSQEYYPMHKILKIWLDAKEKGLSSFLDLDVCLQKGGCNLNVNRMCSTTIRAVQVNADGSLRITRCEDDLSDADIPSLSVEDACQVDFLPEAIAVDDMISPACQLCELFFLCNSCHQWRKANRSCIGHCAEMQKLKSKILKSGWKIQ